MRPILVLGFLGACSGDSPAPNVHVESATPDRLTMSDDAANDITITVSYDDSNGDLGGGMAELHDCRADSLVTTLAIPQIAPKDLVDQHAHISGQLDLFLDDIGPAAASALPTACSELGVHALADMQTFVCVILVDAAGNRGPGDCTNVIALFP